MENDETIPVGAVTALRLHPAGEIPATIGRCLTGEAVFDQNLLASICWQGVRSGIYGGVCMFFSTTDPLDGEWIRSATIEAVRLEILEAACCPRARILESWVEARR